MKFLIFDCETTGVPNNYSASYEDVDNWPRVISLAWGLYDEKGNEIRKRYDLVKPDGWEVPVAEFWINNGYTTAGNMQHGVSIRELLEDFLEAKHEACAIVAHNINFDHRIVWAEFIRAGMEPRRGLHKICTMNKSTAVCRIPAAKGRGFKWPKLNEAYRFLFNCEFENAHNALADIIACKEVFFELVKRGHIDLREVPHEVANPISEFKL